MGPTGYHAQRTLLVTAAMPHPLGPPLGPSRRRCADCFWAVLRGPGPRVLRCRAAGHQRLDGDWQACARFEPEPECLDCAACCGPAFDAVEVSPRDPARRTGVPVRVEGRWVVPRTTDNHCSMLGPGNLCGIYADRPRCCRDFEKGSANCLFARRRAGLSPAWEVT